MLGLFSSRIFMGAVQRNLARRALPIYAYHKIGDAPRATRDPFLYDSATRFAKQLDLLRRFGFNSMSLDALSHAAPCGPGKAVITFDDGCLSVLKNGLPLLLQHEFSGIQFLVPGRLGARNEWDIAKGDAPEQLMNVSEVKEWLAAGQQIGSHSMTHQNLRHLNRQDLAEEVAGSKKALEDAFGIEIRHFSYPYGSWNEAVRDVVAEAGYATACTMDSGLNDSPAIRLQLKRLFPLSSGQLVRKVLHRMARRAHRLG